MRWEMPAGLRVMRVLLLGVLAAFAGACGDSSRIPVTVHVLDLPAGVDSLYVSATLDSFHAESQVSGSLDTFAFYLPEGAFGRLRLELQAINPDGCSSAVSTAEADARPGSGVELQVQMVALLTRLCPLRLSKNTEPGDSQSLVVSTPSGIHCGVNCTAFFPLGSTIDLLAQPRTATLFLGWSGAPGCGAGSICRVTVSQALAVSAQFGDNLITVQPTDDSGRIVSRPAGIDCPGRCSARFPVGSEVVLTATPAVSGKIGHFSGPCQTYTSCRLIVQGAVVAGLAFEDNLLSVRPMGSTDVRIVSEPPGISCGTTCSGSFPLGGVVTLTADAAKSQLVNWSAPCGPGPVCRVTLEQPTQVRVYKAGDASCTPRTLCQHSPRPFVGTFTSIWSSSPENAWLVGVAGGIFHYTKDGVQPAASGVSVNLASVHGSSPTNVWAVGASGTVLRYDGNTWQLVPTGNTNNYSDVWAFSDTDVWIVGTGNALHWDGTALTAVNEPLIASTSEILGLAPNELWVIAASGKVFRYDGTSWVQIPSNFGSFIRGLAGTSATDIWVADTISSLFHWDGTTWQRQVLFTGGTGSANSIVALSNNKVWACGSSLCLYWNGTTWSRVDGISSAIQSLWASAADNLWMLGTGSRVFHWDGKLMLELSSSLGLSQLAAVGGSSASNVLALGPYDSTISYNGSRWSRAPAVPLNNVSAVWFRSATEAWAVDKTLYGGLARWDGTSWRKVVPTLGYLDMLNTVSGTAAGEVWLGGSSADYRFDSTGWISIPTGGVATRGLWANPADNVMWSIDSSRLRMWNGASWSMFPLPLSSANALWGTAANDIWVVGNSGQLAHFTGTAATSVASGTNLNLLSISGTGASSVWAVGQLGVVLRYDGLGFVRLRNPSALTLNSVWASGNKVYMVGDYNTVISYEE